MSIVISQDKRESKEEEAKFEYTVFLKCQKGQEEEEPKRSLHFLRRMKLFLVFNVSLASGTITSRVKPRFV